jgi:dipeptidyl-peptidase 4
MQTRFRQPCLRNRTVNILLILVFISSSFNAYSQPGIEWTNDGNAYYKTGPDQVIRYSLPDNKPVTVISREQLTPAGSSTPLEINYIRIDEKSGKALIMTNSRRVWRLKTRGDYWVLDLKKGTLSQLGKGMPASSLMFAKISPDGKSAAYVSGNNIYAEDLSTAEIKALTRDGSATLINGTFDWAYEEEFYCRDGFRWSSDSKSIAFWQIDAGSIPEFSMINNTDSIYPRIVPLEYPVAGVNPSSAKVGVVNLTNLKTTWMKIEGDPVQNYLVRLEFIPGTDNLLIQQLNRKQNRSRLIISSPVTGLSKVIQEETDEAWVDLEVGKNPYSISYTNSFIWINSGKDILWSSEKVGWRHLWQISLEGKPEKLLTAGEFDVISLEYCDQHSGFIYYMASPENATQKYLFRTSFKNPGKKELLSPASLNGTHDYSISPNGKYAFHSFSNYFTRPSSEFISLPDHKSLNGRRNILEKQDSLRISTTTEFFRISIPGSIEMDGWMAKPKNFDPLKKYPVLFYVYSEPAGTTVNDVWGVDRDFLYDGDLLNDGYIYVSIDNRGTPAPKGRPWRKAIYRKIGQVNIDDQAAGARELLKKYSFMDPERVAVWGWSGGGTATLNLMFRYPDIYKTGISIAAVGYMFTYDNIYQERYMGLPQENREDYIKGSPVTWAGKLKGNLLYIHGTGDDNVHYQNAEILINELIKHNKLFQFMPYPNRTHGISEGEGTFEHLSSLYTDYLRRNCAPGPR